MLNKPKTLEKFKEHQWVADIFTNNTDFPLLHE